MSNENLNNEITIRFNFCGSVTDVKMKENSMIAELIHEYYEKTKIQGPFYYKGQILTPESSSSLKENSMKDGDEIKVGIFSQDSKDIEITINFNNHGNIVAIKMSENTTIAELINEYFERTKVQGSFYYKGQILTRENCSTLKDFPMGDGDIILVN